MYYLCCCFPTFFTHSNNMNHAEQREFRSRLDVMPCCEPTQDWILCLVTMESRSIRQAIDMALHGRKPMITAANSSLEAVATQRPRHMHRDRHNTGHLAWLHWFHFLHVRALQKLSLAEAWQHSRHCIVEAGATQRPRATRGDWPQTRGRH